MKRQLQSAPSLPQQSDRHADVMGESSNPQGFVFGVVDAHWLNAQSAARYLDFPNVRAFYKWVDRAGITKLRCGRSLRFDRRELDRAIDPTAIGLRSRKRLRRIG